MDGTVKWFNDDKGWGFITGPDALEYFVHYSEVQMDGRRTLVEGAKVRFEPAMCPKCPRALRVFPL